MLTADDFLARYGDQTFRHHEELLAGIRAGTYVLDFGPDEARPMPARQLLNIYYMRADLLYDHLVGDHLDEGNEGTAAILADIEAFLVELERHAEESCCIWIFQFPPHSLFSVFDALTSQRVLGCIRMVAPDDHSAEK